MPEPGDPSNDAEDIIGRARKKAQEAAAQSVREQQQRIEAQQKLLALPTELDNAVHWGGGEPPGTETLHFVRCLDRVVALLKAEGVVPQINGPGTMRDAARQMLSWLEERREGYDNRIADLLSALIDDQSIPIEEFMHSESPRNFDHLVPEDHVRYFRTGHGPEQPTLWKDLAQPADIIEFDGRFRRISDLLHADQSQRPERWDSVLRLSQSITLLKQISPATLFDRATVERVFGIPQPRLTAWKQEAKIGVIDARGTVDQILASTLLERLESKLVEVTDRKDRPQPKKK